MNRTYSTKLPDEHKEKVRKRGYASGVALSTALQGGSPPQEEKPTPRQEDTLCGLECGTLR
jgi:hypothetical protein